MTILIAHNKAGTSRSIKSRLTKYGYEVIISKSYPEAFLQVEQLHPDLIITDLASSSLAFQMISEIKKGPDKRTPILILSNVGQENLVEEAFSLGADDYISQPGKLNELYLRINLLAKGRLKNAA
jgi:DNA-binding response OmpR family regulator